MTLKELIQALEAVADKSVTICQGFSNPHSYRGYYDRVAFEPTRNVTIQSMLDCAREALGNTYTGYKGGEYTMTEYTEVHLANYSETGEELGPRLLRHMLNDRSDINGDRIINDQEAWALRELSLWMENDLELYKLARAAHRDACAGNMSTLVQLINKVANKAHEDPATTFPGHVRRELKERMVRYIPPEFDDWLGHWDLDSRELSEAAWKVREGMHVPDFTHSLNPHGPKSKAELWRDVAGYIENEGLHYALVHYTSPEYQNCDQLDPELAKLWRNYMEIAAAIEKHVGCRP